jgi:hypothetical protein
LTFLLLESPPLARSNEKVTFLVNELFSDTSLAAGFHAAAFDFPRDPSDADVGRGGVCVADA